MSRSRPINRRPWRRPPWRKNTRPKRWISLNCGIVQDSGGGAGQLVAAPWEFTPANTGGATANVILASGQIDVEPWADNQEVTIDRIVGDVVVRGAVAQDNENLLQAYAPALYLRMGLMVQEETDPTATPFVDLFFDEHLEDFEWMWLAERAPREWNYPVSLVTNNFGLGFQWDEHLDLRVRRKLGQTDQLLLYAQYGIIPAPAGNGWSVDVNGSHTLRAIFMSR